MSELFAESDALQIVHSEDELTEALRELLSDKYRCKAMGERARKVVVENMGSTVRNVELIREFL